MTVVEHKDPWHFLAIDKGGVQGRFDVDETPDGSLYIHSLECRNSPAALRALIHKGLEIIKEHKVSIIIDAESAESLRLAKTYAKMGAKLKYLVFESE